MMKSVLRAVGVAAVIFMVGCGDDNGVNPDNGGGGSSVTDSRDDRTYRTVVIGGRTWMAQNLNYQTANSWCYNNNNSNCNTYGRLYTWDAAMDNACPSGWRLPTRQDWTDLVTAVGGWSVAGIRLKARSPAWDGNDTHGFSALPGGARWDGSNYNPLGDWGLWWSAAEADEAHHAWYVYTRTDNTDMEEYAGYKSGGLSVRCVRND